ncbi:MAG: hypothetical protein KF696_09770 [Planctomycetes bacterium]|nr:hypothetical protein [Planctomycetota bacterium]MCW8136144.1 hypothetical protein [Planctomycetota bacterium]
MQTKSISRCLLAASPFIAVALASQALDAQAVSNVTQLRQAITDFNAGSTNATISLAAGTYTLTGARLDNANASGDLDITRTSGNITIVGAGQTSTIIDANLVDRVLHITGSSPLTVTLRNLTLRNGLTNDDGLITTSPSGALGGGIYVASDATLVLEDVTIEGCQAIGDDGASSLGAPGFDAAGGGVYQAGGALTLLRTIVRDNNAQGGRGQSSIVSSGSNGGNGGNAVGGGIYIDTGSASITASTITNNSASGGAGGFGADGTSGGSFGGSAGDGGNGGTGRAGGIYSAALSLQIVSSTISNNQATAGNGGNGGDGGAGFFVGGSGGNGGNGGVAEGGALETDDGTIVLRNSTLSNNVSVAGTGAPGGDGGNANGSSGFGGNGGDGGNAGQGRGAGIRAGGGALTITSSTIAANAATSGTPAGGGSGGGGVIGGAPGSIGITTSSTGRGIYLAGGTATLESTILADHGGPDISGTITASASLIEDISEGTIVPGAIANVTGVDPGLFALANNGGATMTHAIDATSPAFNAGSNPASLANDQRGSGFPRVRDGAADIGAFELQVGSGGGGGGKRKKGKSDEKCSTSTGGSPAWPLAGIFGAALLALRRLWRPSRKTLV